MTTDSSSTARLWQATRTYLTRGWAMVGLAAGGVLLALMLLAASMSAEAARSSLPMLLGLPLMGISFFVVHHTKWQFVNPRARLTPYFAQSHLLLLGMLLVLSVLGYPLFVAVVTRQEPLGLIACAALLGGTLMWGTHSARPVWVLIGVAVFFSLALPQLNGLWLEPSPALTGLRALAFAAGWAALGLWLWRLSRMSEEDDDYTIPVQGQMSSGSRAETSEARRYMTQMLGRAVLQTRVTDAWHNRLAGQHATTDAARRRLLRYGLAPVPAGMRYTYLLGMMLAIVVLQVLIVGEPATKQGGGVILQIGFFSFLGPLMSAQLLAMRRVRLAQELLLPLTRESLVRALLGGIVRDSLWMFLLSYAVMTGAAVFLAPELLTLPNALALSCAMLSALPLLVAVASYSGLVRSGMKRMLLMIGVMYLLMGSAGGVFALGYYGRPVEAAAAAAAVLMLGRLAYVAARRQWLNAEFG
ncbi:MAG: hypothetical protein KDA37_06250 [Planctomycetales bacterium]|nr:hypothetical protein [Planctomycetales bacterium]